MKITDLTNLRQRNDESVAGFIQRFREMRNKCYSLSLTDKQLAELAFQGLLPSIREKYASQEFENISQLVHRLNHEKSRPYEPRRNFQKGVSYVDYFDSEGEIEVELAEWVSNRKPIACPFGKKEPEKFGFDITKADKIFDLLL